MSIAPINPPVVPSEIASVAESHQRDHASVGETFGKALEEATHAEQNATQTSAQFAKDDPTIGIHEVMIAAEKANIAVRYATTLKNKAVEAYRELMNTQV
jgi:flagellar hook-basal body complex protein FliE